MVAKRGARAGERFGRAELFGRADADALQEAYVLGVLRRSGHCVVWRRAVVLAFRQSAGDEQHAAARGAPVVNHQVTVTGEADLQNPIGYFAAIA